MQISCFNGQAIAVFGLGRSGVSVAHALIAGGADVRAWDDSDASRASATAENIPLVDLYSSDWSDIAALVISPGVPIEHPAPHPIAKLARDAGVEIIGDMELLARSGIDAGIVGITGTNGKSTTTKIVECIFEASGSQTSSGGNIGVPVLDLEPLDKDGTYVFEISSYQLDLTASLGLDVAMLLNISADHLDRHGGFDGYVAAKKKIFHMLKASATAIIGVDDDACRGIAQALEDDGVSVVRISGAGPVAGGVYMDGGVLYDDLGDGNAVAVLDMTQAQALPGIHNAQNAAAAYAVGRAAGISPDVIVRALKSFPGLAHRQELVAVIDGVSYVNDSKGTNAEAASRALACYGNVYWIAGGLAKDGGLDAVTPYLDRIRHAYLIGEAANDFQAVLEPGVACTVSGTLDVAVGAARLSAISDNHNDPVVLLSPASASFDQFPDFEARGEAFRSAVAALPGVREEARS
ncbi:MAG: UDP-N-acetylmuramoyl-L-alanine--D-glutamate ligase [Rhodospirillaceae bacterium]|nr:UDP-N-acetylmuramoyl-L-alanine--D-glutamate ligase [Rhodospirillaceae bacterium]